MSDLRAAAQQALEAYDSHQPLVIEMEKLRTALEQPEHDYRTRYDRPCYKCRSHYCPGNCPDSEQPEQEQAWLTGCPSCGMDGGCDCEALDQPEQEPVAWMVYTLDGKSVCVTDNPADFADGHRALPLYTHPPSQRSENLKSRAWRGLTDEEIENYWDGYLSDYQLQMIRDMEAALKEKNHE
jgi:hypothetical protein